MSKEKRNLPRLNREAYRGLAVAHWIFNIEGRKTGWLDDEFFLRFQNLALHAFSRYGLVAPCLVAMPDHIHMLLMGISEKSDQKLATPFLRKHLEALLEPDFALQKTPYDHVLRQDERKRNEFADQVGYVRANPFRAGLAAEESDPWPYECCVVPGYPELDVKQNDYWERFWRVYSYLVDKNGA